VAGFDELIWRGFMNGRHVSGGGLLLKAIGELDFHKNFMWWFHKNFIKITFEMLELYNIYFIFIFAINNSTEPFNLFDKYFVIQLFI
jgi:hypothetical protein